MEGEINAESDEQVIVLLETSFEDDLEHFLVAVDEIVVAEVGE